MALIVISNATDTELTNVNAAGADVPAYSCGTDGVGTAAELTAAELETLLSLPGITVLSEGSSDEERRLGSKIQRLGRDPGTATDDV